MKPEDDRSVALTHMLGYINEDQQADADSQGFGDDDIHLLGYLEDKHWNEAVTIFTIGNSFDDLIALAKLVNARYKTNFLGELFSSKQFMIAKYTKYLANVKENQAKEDTQKTGGLTDIERHEFESIIRIYAEAIRDFKALPDL